jgi:hypothetical protein
MIQAVSSRPLTEQSWLRPQASLCEICGELGGTWTGLSPTPSVLLCRLHSTTALYSIFTLSLPEERKFEAWEPSKKEMFFRKIGGLG